MKSKEIKNLFDTIIRLACEKELISPDKIIKAMVYFDGDNFTVDLETMITNVYSDQIVVEIPFNQLQAHHVSDN